MGFDDRLLHMLVIKRLAPAATGGAETVAGADTTLTADIVPDALTVTVASDTGIAEDDWLRIGDEGETEYRQVASVLAGIVTLTEALALPHDSGDQVRQVDDAGGPVLDDYSQPVSEETTVATVPGLIQPRPGGHEVEILTQAGAVISRHIGYLRPLEGLGTDCWLERGGIRYDILELPDAAGLGHHLELPLRAVT